MLVEMMVNKAKELYGEIKPCGKFTWEQCLTTYKSTLLLWFNDSGGSTHILAWKGGEFITRKT